jgi:hypothetical protein
MRYPIVALCLALAACLPAAAVSAQQPTTGGFLSAYEPSDRGRFEAGYRRHLDWHRLHEDSLSWFGWDVLVGPRTGAFVDGVFGVPFAALDVRVDPAGDQADAAENVLPHARTLPREMVRLRRDLSSATPLETGSPTRVVEVVWLAVPPPGSDAAESALAALLEASAGGTLLPYTVYRGMAGGVEGFVVMIWHDRLATFDDPRRDPRRALLRLLGDAGPGAAGGARVAASEVWLYRPDLTHAGGAGEER